MASVPGLVDRVGTEEGGGTGELLGWNGTGGGEKDNLAWAGGRLDVEE